ncbi:hypothetical protein [Thiococcus pfennigii]|uniref:hypothetical protein n=1 Tax=Thiococcus pfennigii TaxID=1057 RepID=UPI0019045720|nr:hypothetical protein [Thiococcus pfennigii]MBK1732059.1 hypothetical protein [Thiococcus pfennigii]
MTATNIHLAIGRRRRLVPGKPASPTETSPREAEPIDRRDQRAPRAPVHLPVPCGPTAEVIERATRAVDPADGRAGSG